MSRYLPLLLLSLLGVIQGYVCPAQSGAYAVCATTVVYILDTTPDISSSDAATEFGWIRDHILPGTAWGTNQQLALMSYGTGNALSYPATGRLSEACGQLDSLQNTYNERGSTSVTLLQTMQVVDVYYGNTINNMVLFSASKNPGDISDTAKYILNNMAGIQITVIALNGANFSGFPATAIYNVYSLASYPQNLPSCILKNACNQGSTCDINGATDATVSFTTITTTPPPLVTTKPATAAPSPQTEGPQCSCNWTTTWVDIMVVLDVSSASGQESLNEMWSVADAVLGWLTLARTTDPVKIDYSSRAGIVTYGNTATVYRPLGSVNNTDIGTILDLPSNNETITNLEAGIQVAAAELSGPAHRQNAKKVIIVFATTFNPQGSHPPQEAARTFISDGGILMVYNYIPQHGTQTVDPILKNITSPGYYFTNFNTSFVDTDLNDALCDGKPPFDKNKLLANCFCPTYFYPFSNSPRQTPTGGCYQGVNAATNYPLASHRCTLSNNGFLAYDESYNKTVFLGQQLENKPTNFLIGLTWDQISYSWKWSNGTSLGPYQPWVGGSTPTGGGNIGCVYVNYNNQWAPTDCRNTFVYVCEASPCDSIHYCP